MASIAGSAMPQRAINAVVVSSGLMQKTVKVRVGAQQWNNHIRKHFSRPNHVLVHDPASSLRTGDVVSIAPGWRTSKHVRHVVTSIIAPFGPPIDERPAVPTEEERLEARLRKKGYKAARRKAVAAGADVPTEDAWWADFKAQMGNGKEQR